MKNINHEYFPKLKFEVLQRLAGEWVEKHPSIQKIILFKYSLRDRSSTTEYAISATYDPEHPEAEDYLTWTFGNESCGHVIAKLADAYNGNPPSNYEDNWIWFDDKPGEEQLNPFIVPEKKYVLYPPPITPISSEGGEQQKTIFPCEPGTKWEDIHITLISDDTVKIKTPFCEERFGYRDLGLKYGKANKPKRVWTYLKVFAKAQGIISAKTFDDLELKKDLITYASKLNKYLQRLFGINESIYNGHYKKQMRYDTKIMFSDATQIVGTKPKNKEQSKSEEIGEMFQKFEEHDNI